MPTDVIATANTLTAEGISIVIHFRDWDTRSLCRFVEPASEGGGPILVGMNRYA